MFQSNRLAKSQTKAICFYFCSSGCSAVDDPGDFVLILQPQPACDKCLLEKKHGPETNVVLAL